MEEIMRAVREAAGAYPVRRVYLFGSYANGTATEESDVDLYVEFSESPISFFKYCGFRAMLIRLLDKDVDIVKLSEANQDEKMILIYEA